MKNLSFERLNISTMLMSLFAFFIPVDMLNGYLLRNLDFSISIYFKLAVLLLVFVSLLRTRYRNLTLILALISFILYFMPTILHGDPRYLDTQINIFKFTSTYIFAIFFVYYMKKNNVSALISLAKYTYFFLIINTLVGLAGLGYPMYGDETAGIGTRGLIFAGNELGVAVLVSGGIIMFHFLVNDKIMHFSIFGIIMLVNSLLLSSKVSMLGTFLIIIAYAVIYTLSTMQKMRVKSQFFYFLFFILVILIPLSYYYVSQIFFDTEIGKRIYFFYERLDFLNFLLSGRDIRINDGVIKFQNDYSVIELLFGSNRKAVYTESDLFDMLFRYGLLGLSVVVLVILVPILMCIRNTHTNHSAIYIFVLLVLILFIANTAGHTIVSGTSSHILAVLIALVFQNTKKIDL